MPPVHPEEAMDKKRIDIDVWHKLNAPDNRSLPIC